MSLYKNRNRTRFRGYVITRAFFAFLRLVKRLWGAFCAMHAKRKQARAYSKVPEYLRADVGLPPLGDELPLNKQQEKQKTASLLAAVLLLGRS